MLKVYKLIAIVLTVALILSACGKQDKQAKQDEIKIKDKLGVQMIPKHPKRIVVLEYSFIDSLAALNVSPVGIADDGNSKNIIKLVKDKIGKYESVGSRKQPNLEIISKLKPDLIIADVARHKKLKQDLDKIGPTLMLDSSQGDYQDGIEAFKTIAKAIGKEQQGHKRLEQHDHILAQTKEIVAKHHLKSALPLGVSEAGLFINSDKSYMGQFLQNMGIKSNLTEQDKAVIKNSKGPYLFLNGEELTRINPQAIIYANNGAKDKNQQKFIDDKVWNALTAVKNKQVYQVDRTKWMKFRGIITSESMADDLKKLVKQ